MTRLIVSLFTILVFGCTTGGVTEKDIDVRMDEVMAEHDVVMPLMEDLFRARKSLMGLLPDHENSPVGAELETAISDITSARGGMDDWMENFDVKLENKTNEEKMVYLDAEFLTIENVGQQMRSSLKKGRELITRLNE